MSDVLLQAALRDIILDLGITPKATAILPTVGAQSLTLSSATHFQPGGLIGFDDAAGEEMLPISSTSGTTISLDFTGLGYLGLQQAHADGVSVYTNLCTDSPAEIAPMLTGSDPFVFVFLQEEKERIRGMHRAEVISTIRIQYHRLLVKPYDTPMDPNVWARRQQESARADLERIANAVRTKRTLSRSGGGGIATGLGDTGNPARPYMSRTWTRMALENDTQQFIACLDVTVTTMTVF